MLYNMSVIEKTVLDIPFAGIQGMTTIDYPGHLAAVLFTRGCSWNCRYCHNHELRDFTQGNSISGEDIKSFLLSRLDYLESIVISGGEPTLHPSLPHLLESIRELGYKTALHTNGTNPDMLRNIIKRGILDFIALDIKGPPRAYDRITQKRDTCFAVSRSIDIILSSNIEYEFRTTYHPLILSEKEILEVMNTLYSIGCRRYYIQKFRKEGVCDEELVNYGFISLPSTAVTLGKKLFPEFGVR